MKRLLLPLTLLFAATANAAAQTPISWKEDTAANRGIPFYFVDRTDLVTPETGLTITGAECVISKAGGSFSNCGGTWVEIAAGNYHYRPTQAEVDTIGTIVVKVDEAAARIERSTALVIGDSSGEAQSCTSSTVVLQSDSSATDDFYNKQVVSFLEGNAKAVSRVCNDYTGSTKTCSVDTLPANCSSGDRYVLLPGASALTSELTTAVNSGGSSSVGSSFVAADLVTIYNASVGAVTNSTTTMKAIPGTFQPARFYLDGDYTSGTTTTLDVVVQHSIDGVDWVDYGSFTQVGTTDVIRELAVTSPVYQYVRLKITTTGTSPVYTVTAYVVGATVGKN